MIPKLKQYRKNKAIKSYVLKLPSLLSARYGLSETYTTGQVQSTILECGFNTDYIDYAYALFCSAEKLDPELIAPDKYSRIREYLTSHYFGGDSGFSATNVSSFALTGIAFSGIIGFFFGDSGDGDGGAGFGDGGGGGDG